ncbi:membrane protein [Marinobacterium nitratireducens]|uniref:Membrane protein n=1 Tax=Marinobacterium nitratireducens TaxID=518897 RepID=A0A918DVY0_9GAMM|nr:MAPEG family protein [Marinobacterium nitratireducens]GGO84626.1 membrane protein [Marinobacterium nitratireducens]
MPVVLYVLFFVSILPVLLAGVGNFFRARQFGAFDNHHPRLQQAQLEGTGARVQAAQANAWEALMVFGSSCFIAYASGVPLESLSLVALVFLLCRILHAIFYIADLAMLRSLIFGVATLCCFYIVYLAATLS